MLIWSEDSILLNIVMPKMTVRSRLFTTKPFYIYFHFKMFYMNTLANNNDRAIQENVHFDELL